jgi:AraC-like DNA-binding protein
LARIPQVLRELGTDPVPVFLSAGFDARRFDDPEVRIPYIAASRLLARCADASRCEHFGLLVGMRSGPSDLGLAGFLLRCAPDVGTALRDLERYLMLHDRGAAPVLASNENSASLGYAIHEPGAEASEVIYDIAIAVTCNLMRSLCGADWNPAEVLLARRAPRDPVPYTRFFRAPVRFDSERSAAVFPADLLLRPVPSADPQLRRHLKDEAERQLDASHPLSATGLRALLRQLLLENRCSCAEVAGRLGIHARTLNRRLLAQGTTFQQERDAVREAVAKELLAGTSIGQEAIAAALGYSDASAFNRAFRRRTGITPARWRGQPAGSTG